MHIRSVIVSLVAATAVALASVSAQAQIGSLSAAKNAGNSPDEEQDGTFISFERESFVQPIASSPTQFTVRYQATVGTDTGLGSSDTTEGLVSDYTISFTAMAPGGYQLLVTTSVNGAFTIVDDFGGPSAAVDMSGVTGTPTGGTMVGSISLTDPGSLSSSSTANTPFNRTSSATITGLSNGIPQAHTLRFQWSQSCFSNGGLFENGDECALRLGLPIDYASESAGDYPGIGSRNAAADGHFVTVTLLSLCGNSVVDAGEQCDTGPSNGLLSSCCTSSCQFRPTGQVCRDSAGTCDTQEVCSGGSGVCPADAKSTEVCRPASDDCDAPESCNGISNNCPADGFLGTSSICRPLQGPCDVPDHCTGSGPACPADQKSTAPCRASAGPCDTAENCDGSGNTCPPDQFQPASTVCRIAAGQCDLPENCTGGAAACPPDVLVPNGSPCSDGDICTVDSCQGGVCTGVPNLDVCTDDFLCYKARTSQATPLPGVALADAFESGNFLLRKGKFLCNPADKNGEGTLDLVTHLRGYIIKPATGSSPHVRRTNLLVTNQLGQIRLDTIKADLLLVPSGKDLLANPPVPDPQSHNVDHYKCYKVKVTPGTPKFVRTQVTVEDQFTSPAKTFDLRKPKELCLPVDKNGEGIKNGDGRLLCYLAKPALGQPKHVPRLGVYTNNQFGPERVNTVKESLLCIPSEGSLSPSGAFLETDADLLGAP